MTDECKTTVVTASDANYAWGVLLLAASMRRYGMKEPLLVGAVNWPERLKDKLRAVGGVAFVDLPGDRRSVTCQKPEMMMHPDVKTPWVSWADCDGIFIGDCSDLMLPKSEGEILIRRYSPPPPDFTPENVEVWRRDVGERETPRLDTRLNAPFISIHRSQMPFLRHWREQMAKVLPTDVGIVMARNSPYFQTDESVLGSLLLFAHDAPEVAATYTMNGSTTNGERYFAHFAYNPKPWQMWNGHCLKWYEQTMGVVDWLLERGIAEPREVPFALRRSHESLHRLCAPLAPQVWRAKKLKRKLKGWLHV